MRYNDLIMITEGGTATISLIVETPYRNIQPDLAPHASGFADMVIGTKTLLFDSELLQISHAVQDLLADGQLHARGSAPGTSRWSRRCSWG